MLRRIPRLYSTAAALAVAAALASAQRYGPAHTWWDAGMGGYLPWDESFDNPDGQVTIVNHKGSVQTKGHPFFEALGTNGRACVTCHQPANAMALSGSAARQRWIETGGRDPLFAAIDGSNCPDLPQEAAASHSLLLDRGLIRIPLPWPPKDRHGAAIHPDFRLEVVSDPTGCNTSPVYGVRSAHPSISVYRRPRIAANLNQVSVLMSDGREPSLESQAISAILGHEESGTHPTLEQLRRIVAFESQVYAAQGSDIRGGLLEGEDGPALLGPQNLASGKAGKFGDSAREMVHLFDVWRRPKGAGDLGLQREFRASIARGADLFFGRCAGCHTAGTTRWIEIGTTQVEDPSLPLFRITCNDGGRVFETHDPGRALITGHCEDAGAIVLGQMRGLAARPPYFSNGGAETLRDVVDYYSRRFSIPYNEWQKQDLINFLKSL